MVVMTWNRSATTVRTAALDHLVKTTQKANGERWKELHRYIRLQDVPKLGHVPSDRRRCWEAQMCLCTGDGRFTDQMMSKLLASLRICSRMNGNFRPLLKRGHLVARFECINPGLAHPDHPAGQPVPDDVSDVWLHVALFYERPIRPTYILMERNPDRDEAGTLGVAPWCGPHSEDLYLATQWEAFSFMNVGPNTKSWTLTWYELVCFSKRLLRPFEPRRQRVRALAFEPIDLLRLVVPKQRRAPAPGGRARGGARGVRGRGRAARGAEAPGRGGPRRGRAARGRGAAGAEEPQAEAGASSDSGLSLRRGFSDADVEPEEVSDGGSGFPELVNRPGGSLG